MTLFLLDQGEGDTGIPIASSSTSDAEDMERLVRLERQRLEELLRTSDMRRGSLPAFVVSAKGPKVSFLSSQLI